MSRRWGELICWLCILCNAIFNQLPLHSKFKFKLPAWQCGACTKIPLNLNAAQVGFGLGFVFGFLVLVMVATCAGSRVRRLSLLIMSETLKYELMCDVGIIV